MKLFESLSVRALLLAAFLLARSLPADPGFSSLPVDVATQEWFRSEVDSVCRNSAGEGTGVLPSEFRCKDSGHAYDASRARLEGPGGLARRCARGKQEFDASIPIPLVEPVESACGAQETGLLFAICAQQKVYDRLESDPKLKAITASMSEEDHVFLEESRLALRRWVDAEVRTSLVTRICMQAGGIVESDSRGELRLRARPDHPDETCQVDPFYDVPVEFSSDWRAGSVPPEQLSRLRDRLLWSAPGGLMESQCPSFAGASEACGAERALTRAHSLSTKTDGASGGVPSLPIDSDVLDAVIEADVSEFLGDYRKHYEREMRLLAAGVLGQLSALGTPGADAADEREDLFKQKSSCFLKVENPGDTLSKPSPEAALEWEQGLIEAASLLARQRGTAEALGEPFHRHDGLCTWTRDRVDPDPIRRRRCEQIRAGWIDSRLNADAISESLPLLEADVDGVPLWRVLNHELSEDGGPTPEAQAAIRTALDAQADALARQMERHCEDPDASTRQAVAFEALGRSYLELPGKEGRGFAFCAVYSQVIQNEGLRESGIMLAQLGATLAAGPFGQVAMAASAFALSAWEGSRHWENARDREDAYLTGMGSYADAFAAREERWWIGAGVALDALFNLGLAGGPSGIASSARVVRSRFVTAVGEGFPELKSTLELRDRLISEGVRHEWVKTPDARMLRVLPDAGGPPISRYAALLDKDGYSLLLDPNLKSRTGSLGYVSPARRQMALSVEGGDGELLPRTGKPLLVRMHEHQHFRLDRELHAGKGPFLGTKFYLVEGPPMGHSYGQYFRLDELRSFGWGAEAQVRTLASDLAGPVGRARFHTEGWTEALDRISRESMRASTLASRQKPIIQELKKGLESGEFSVKPTKDPSGRAFASFEVRLEERLIEVEIPLPDSELADPLASVLRQIDRIEQYGASVESKHEALWMTVIRLKGLSPEKHHAAAEALKVFGVGQRLPSEPTFRAWSLSEWRTAFDQELQYQLQRMKAPVSQ